LGHIRAARLTSLAGFSFYRLHSIYPTKLGKFAVAESIPARHKGTFQS